MLIGYYSTEEGQLKNSLLMQMQGVFFLHLKFRVNRPVQLLVGYSNRLGVIHVAVVAISITSHRVLNVNFQLYVDNGLYYILQVVYILCDLSDSLV